MGRVTFRVQWPATLYRDMHGDAQARSLTVSRWLAEVAELFLAETHRRNGGAPTPERVPGAEAQRRRPKARRRRAGSP